MKLSYFLLADAATIDTSNKVNILGIFDRLFASEVPVVHPLMTIVFELIGIENDKIQIKLIAKHRETGIEMFRHETVDKCDLTKGDRYRLTTVLAGLSFPKFGEYDWTLEVDGHAFEPTVLSVIKV